MTDAVTIPGLYWQLQRQADATVDHSGHPVFIGALAGVEAGSMELVQGWSRFRSRFGDGRDHFRLAIRGFFNNGGALCKVLSTGEATDATSLAAALDVLVDDDDVSLVVAPGVVDVDLQAMLLEHCDLLGERFAVLDLPEPTQLSATAAVETAIARARELQTRTSSDNGALYGPWIKVVTDEGPVFGPPSGHVAGIYMRVDARSGRHHAPANETLEDAVDLRFALSDAQLATVYPPLALDANGRIAEPSVNIIRALPGRGLRVWGARTLSTDPTWRHVPVRRLTLDLERWMTRRLDGLVFEINDVVLRNRVVRELGAYLDRLYHRGALVGPVSELAWYIQCDENNNPADVQQAGLLIADVGIAPAVPGEYITLRLITRSGTDAQTETLSS